MYRLWISELLRAALRVRAEGLVRLAQPLREADLEAHGLVQARRRAQVEVPTYEYMYIYIYIYIYMCIYI